MSNDDVVPCSKIVVASHRGGCGKTTVAALLSYAMVRAEIDTTLIDLCQAGGVSSFARTEDKKEVVRRNRDTGEDPTLRILPGDRVRSMHYPLGQYEEDPSGALARNGMIRQDEIFIYDTPVIDLRPHRWIFKNATMVLVPMPVDAVGFRTSLPFLQMLQEERAKPGRRFQVKLLLVRTGHSEPEMRMLEDHMRRHLADSLMNVSIPYREAIDQSISNAVLPQRASEVGGAALLDELANEVLTTLNESQMVAK